MTLLLNLDFWICAFLAPLILLLVKKEYFLVGFSLLNTFFIFLLFGYQVLAIAITISLVVWGGGIFILNRNAWLRLALVVIILFPSFVVFKLAKTNSIFNFQSDRVHDGFLNALFVLSFSYVVLRIYDYWRSVVNGSPKGNPLTIMGYLFPFHMLIAGPISLYNDYCNYYVERVNKVKFDYIVHGIYLISSGLMYKFVIAELIRIYVYGLGHPIIASNVYDSALVLVYLFFDFAGYSLVALGIGHLCGIATPRNFDKPFISCSVTEFWGRWHISLGVWIKTNIFFPLQLTLVRRFGVKYSALLSFVTLIFSFLIAGIWHSFTISFIIWGLFLAFIMAAEKLIRDKFISRLNVPFLHLIWRVLGPIYVLIVISTSLLIIIDDIF